MKSISMIKQIRHLKLCAFRIQGEVFYKRKLAFLRKQVFFAGKPGLSDFAKKTVLRQG